MKFPAIGNHDTVYLHTELSERLLERLCQNVGGKNQISDLQLSLFDHCSTRLRSSRISNASELSVEGLKVLRGHRLLEIEIQDLANATVSDVIDDCLGKYVGDAMGGISKNWQRHQPNNFTQLLTQTQHLIRLPYRRMDNE